MLLVDGNTELDRQAVGGKAHYLGLLMSLGMRVPATAVIPPSDDVPTREICEWLTDTLRTDRKWDIAIRSSSAEEDTLTSSKAGHFLSVLGTFDEAGIREGIARVRRSGPSMAVVLQPLIGARLSGVAFSCDPLTYRRDRLSIAWTEGLGDQLVQGTEHGQSLLIQQGHASVGDSWPESDELLHQLTKALSVIESAMNRPADVEWVIDEEHQLWIVQARPVVLPASRAVRLDSEQSFASLPALVQGHPKIRLRRDALRAGVTMAPALIETCSASQPAIESSHEEFGVAAGLSVVLLYPERIEQSVVREFSPVRGFDVSFFTRGCRRYAIRRYPRVRDSIAAKKAVQSAGFSVSWLSVTIVQAIWRAHATGIVRRSDRGYIIDIAQGHFVPKGVVETSTIILSPDRKPVSSLWREQSIVYHFMDGHVVTESPPDSQLQLTPEVLSQLTQTFDPVFDLYPDAALEFGMKGTLGGFDFYLIDLAEGDNASVTLEAELITSGVLSPGHCSGRLVRLGAQDQSALDSHLHDIPNAASLGDEKIVIAAGRASIDLLTYVDSPAVAGFVFGQGSVLAHLAVVLRERGIPAITLDNPGVFDSLVNGEQIVVDALSVGLQARERLNRGAAKR